MGTHTGGHRGLFSAPLLSAPFLLPPYPVHCEGLLVGWAEPSFSHQHEAAPCLRLRASAVLHIRDIFQQHDSFHLGSRAWPQSLCIHGHHWGCAELEQESVEVTIAPAETICHFCRSAAQQSSQVLGSQPALQASAPSQHKDMVWMSVPMCWWQRGVLSPCSAQGRQEGSTAAPARSERTHQERTAQQISHTPISFPLFPKERSTEKAETHPESIPKCFHPPLLFAVLRHLPAARRWVGSRRAPWRCWGCKHRTPGRLGSLGAHDHICPSTARLCSPITAPWGGVKSWHTASINAALENIMVCGNLFVIANGAEGIHFCKRSCQPSVSPSVLQRAFS